ncbi:MAG: arginine--tRNA ligase [Pseudobdellovibrionaceae bacterium]
MRTLHDHLRVYLSKKILAALSEPGSFKVEELAEQFVEPPNSDLGDLAFGCFILAKNLKKAPPALAQELKAKIPLDQDLLSVEAAGPYLNFKFSSAKIGEALLAPIRSGEHFQRTLTEKTPKTMIEFSQPNTHKELHVGHMRNACLGDSLVRLLRYCDYEIISSTFPGDVGTHVAKCLWYLKYHNTEPMPAKDKGEWIGKIYSKAHLKLEDETGTAKEAENREKLTAILHELEAKKGEYFELWKETKSWSLDLMKEVYAWAGIEFDHWYWESDVDSDSVQYVKKLYQEGKLEKSEGAIGMNLEAEKLGFCLLLKSDGTGLYATKDLELARRKFQDYQVENNIYVVDMRQELHFKQVFKVLEKLDFPQAKNCFHLKYNFVELPDGAMSSRKGNIVPLMELVHRMEDMVKTNYLSRYENEWPAEDIQRIATQVAQGAIKYGMLRMDTNKKIVFDMNEWLKLDGESGPFIQYSGARIQSLLRKLGPVAASVQWKLLVHPAERKLMQSLMNFHSIVLGSSENYKPHLLCTYLYETAKRFNVFYHECSIGQAETEDLKQARLALSEATGKILIQGLSLLGIPSPEKM